MILPQLIGPQDGGAGSIINPWPMLNSGLYALITATAIVIILCAVLTLLKK